MSDRIDPSTRPAPADPWPPAHEDRGYDRGRRWCVQRDAHPDENHGYPGDAHIPFDECRTTEYYLDHIPDPTDPTNTTNPMVAAVPEAASDGPDGETSRTGLAGSEYGLSIYAASPFRFGQPRPLATTVASAFALGRTASGSLAPYVVLETWPESGTAGEVTPTSHDPSATTTTRVRLALGEALRLARILTQLVDTVSPRPDGT